MQNKEAQGIAAPSILRLRIDDIIALMMATERSKFWHNNSEVKSSAMAGRSRGLDMKKAALSEVKDELSKFLRMAEQEDVVITRHGKNSAGVLIGLEDEEDWFEDRLENDPRFLKRIGAGACLELNPEWGQNRRCLKGLRR
ncbi:MAG: type II toxin-antitoxin system Phd/YefM family antitoxin [Desulfomicrobium escambiense]|nr:type II toxin-antitoxin system Phd/YefM family antitoxin [Desulfomicrobium escambiense]